MIVLTPGGQFAIVPEDFQADTVRYLTTDRQDARNVALGVVVYHHQDTEPEALVETGPEGIYSVVLPRETAASVLLALTTAINPDSYPGTVRDVAVQTLRTLQGNADGIRLHGLAVIP